MHFAKLRANRVAVLRGFFFGFWFCLRLAGRGRDSACRIGWHRASGLFFPALRQESERESRSLAWLKRRLESGRSRRQRCPYACNTGRLADLFRRAADPTWAGRERSALRCRCLAWVLLRPAKMGIALAEARAWPRKLPRTRLLARLNGH